MMWKRNSNIMMSMLRLKAAGNAYLMNKFIRQNFAFATKNKNASVVLAVSEVIQIKLYRGTVKNGSFGWLFFIW